MKKMLLLSLLIPYFLLADSVQFRTVVSRDDGVVGGDFYLDLEMQITAGTSPRTLSSFTIDVYYDSQLSEWPSGLGNPATSWAFGSAEGYSRSLTPNSGFYRILVTGGSVNQDGNVPPAEGSPRGWDVTTSWQKTLTMRWKIAQATSVNITIADDTDDAAYFDNYTNSPQGLATNWIVSNQDLGDTSLPVELYSFTASLQYNHILLEWVTQSEQDNLGFNIYRSTSPEGPFERINSELISGAGTSTSELTYQFVDQRLQSNMTFYYKLENVDINGHTQLYGPREISVGDLSLPDEFSLAQNYPNPFNPTTLIGYDLPEDTFVNLTVYNVRGELVRTLVMTDKMAGEYSIQWDGLDDRGVRVPTGLYFYKIKAGSFSDIKKMLLTK